MADEIHMTVFFLVGFFTKKYFVNNWYSVNCILDFIY